MFANSVVLILLLLLPLFAAFFLWRNRAKTLALRRIGDEQLINVLMGQIDSRRRLWKSALWLAAVGALILALARPVWGVETELVEARGSSIIVVLDISSSMDAEDVLPSRIQRAKLDARRIFEENQSNELGLVLFAGSAFVQFPLTIDSISAVTFLNATSTRSTTNQGTEVEEALRLAMNTFHQTIDSSSIIILLTDGENQQGDPLVAAQEAAERGIIVHVIGYGTEEGASIPLYDENGTIIGYKTDAQGAVVSTRLDEPILEQITETTGGMYQRASETGAEVQVLLNAIAEADSGALASRTVSRRVERFEIFVALALLALTVEIFLPERRAA